MNPRCRFSLTRPIAKMGSASVGASFKPSAQTNSTKWGVSYLIYPCSTTVTASKDTNARINPPLASTIVFDRLESRRKWRDSSRPLDAFSKLKWQLVGANGFKPAPTPCWPWGVFKGSLRRDNYKDRRPAEASCISQAQVVFDRLGYRPYN